MRITGADWTAAACRYHHYIACQSKYDDFIAWQVHAGDGPKVTPERAVVLEMTSPLRCRTV